MSSVRTSYLEDRENVTFIGWLMSWITWLLVFGNARTERRQIRNPRYVTGGSEPEFLTIDEGTLYYSDPLTLWGCYIPIFSGLAAMLCAIPLSPVAAIPFLVGGGVGVVWGIGWFILCTEMLPPVTLAIRQIVGTMYLRDCRITVFPPWLRNSIGVVIVRIPGARGITIESSTHEPTTLLKSHMLMKSGTMGVTADTQVEVTFDGVFVFGLDIRWAHTLKAVFFDDYLANPPETGESIADDVTRRCRRLIQPVIYAACDPTLQEIEWITAVGRIGEINSALLRDLPGRLEHLAIHFEAVLLSAAYGRPFDELRRKTDAQLTADAETQVAASDQAAKVARANADAEIAEAQADSDRRAREAKAKANRLAGVAQQEADLAIATAELTTAEKQLAVSRQRADIAVAPLLARLAAIGTQQSTALMDGLLSLEPGQRLAVLQQLASSLGTAPVPGTIVSVANGSGLDTFPAPALMNALKPLLDGFQRAMQPGATPQQPSP